MTALKASVLNATLVAATVVVALSPADVAAQGIAPDKLTGLVIDDTKAELVGEWLSSTSIGPFLGESYIHDMAKGKGEKSVKFTFRVKKP
ncbi:MAG: hypothetical protein ACI8P0_001971, partial [Planctomycetaceae bacterium]